MDGWDDEWWPREEAELMISAGSPQHLSEHKLSNQHAAETC